MFPNIQRGVLFLIIPWMNKYGFKELKAVLPQSNHDKKRASKFPQTNLG